MSDIYFSEHHAWAEINGNEAKIGITDYAQKSLGDITLIDLPRAGTEVDQNDAVCVIESIKTAYEVCTPLSGVVIAMNKRLTVKPELISEEPMLGGWIFKLGNINPKEFSDLMNQAEYEAMLEKL